MYIRAIRHYVPSQRVENSYFTQQNGNSEEWMHKRTGIETRARASSEENTQTMALSALTTFTAQERKELQQVNLIVGATYTPFDTIYTLAHAVQRELVASEAQVLTLSSACSSFVNAMEVVEGYFATGKAASALVVVSEHNSAYSHDEDAKSGHLWGDGAAVVWITAQQRTQTLAKVLAIATRGGATLGKSPTAVTLQPRKEGLRMPEGRDVFVHAVAYMEQSLRQVVQAQKLNMEDLAYIIPHQANKRISRQLAKNLNVADDHLLSTIEKFGNTGAAGGVITLSEHRSHFCFGDLVGLTFFGGGYSMGAILVEWL